MEVYEEFEKEFSNAEEYVRKDNKNAEEEVEENVEENKEEETNEEDVVEIEDEEKEKSINIEDDDFIDEKLVEYDCIVCGKKISLEFNTIEDERFCPTHTDDEILNRAENPNNIVIEEDKDTEIPKEEIKEEPKEIINKIVTQKEKDYNYKPKDYNEELAIYESKYSKDELEILDGYNNILKWQNQNILGLAMDERTKYNNEQRIIKDKKEEEEKRIQQEKDAEEEEKRVKAEEEAEQLKKIEEEEQAKIEKEEQKEETKKTKQKDLYNQVRGLLKDYPMRIEFDGITDDYSLIGTIIQVNDLLNFCQRKTNDENVQNRILEKIEEINSKININELRDVFYQTKKTKSMMKKRILLNNLSKIINSKRDDIIDIIIYWSLAVPGKDRKFMHLKTAHGFPGMNAEEFESEAIKEGKKVSIGDSFKVTEEGGIELA